MIIEVSAEMIRLLGILAGCPNGATRRELIMQDVKGSLIYEAVMLSLVRVKRNGLSARTTYRFQILPAGIQPAGCARMIDPTPDDDSGGMRQRNQGGN